MLLNVSGIIRCLIFTDVVAETLEITLDRVTCIFSIAEVSLGAFLMHCILLHFCSSVGCMTTPLIFGNDSWLISNVSGIIRCFTGIDIENEEVGNSDTLAVSSCVSRFKISHESFFRSDLFKSFANLYIGLQYFSVEQCNIARQISTSAIIL